MNHAPHDNGHVFDNPRNVLRVVHGLYVVCALLFLIDVVGLAMAWFGGGGLRHAETAWEGFPGFYALYGFVACTLLVLVAKELRKILMRPEDYYDR